MRCFKRNENVKKQGKKSRNYITYFMYGGETTHNYSHNMTDYVVPLDTYRQDDPVIPCFHKNF